MYNCTTQVVYNCTTQVVMGPSQMKALALGECRFRGFYRGEILGPCVSGVVFRGLRGMSRKEWR